MAGGDWSITLVGSREEDVRRQAIEVSNKRDAKKEAEDKRM